MISIDTGHAATLSFSAAHVSIVVIDLFVVLFSGWLANTDVIAGSACRSVVRACAAGACVRVCVRARACVCVCVFVCVCVCVCVSE